MLSTEMKVSGAASIISGSKMNMSLSQYYILIALQLEDVHYYCALSLVS